MRHFDGFGIRLLTSLYCALKIFEKLNSIYVNNMKNRVSVVTGWNLYRGSSGGEERVKGKERKVTLI